MPRQKLQFNGLDEVLDHLNGLLEGGYEQAGNWSLGQNCNHLSVLMEFSQRFDETRPGKLADMIRAPIFVMTLGGTAGNLGISLPTLPFARPKKPVENDDAFGVKRLTATIEKQECRPKTNSFTRFHLWHCAHHLGFLVPKSKSERHHEPERVPEEKRSSGTARQTT